MDNIDINKIYNETLNDKTLDMKSKLNVFIKTKDKDYSKLTKVLLDYENTMVDDVEEKKGSAMGITLCSTLVDVIKEKDSMLFTNLFRLVNITFNNFKNSAYNEYKLHRFLYLWNNDTLLRTHNVIIPTICALCDPKTRESNRRRILLSGQNKAFLINDTHLTPDDIAKIELYYGLK